MGCFIKIMSLFRSYFASAGSWLGQQSPRPVPLPPLTGAACSSMSSCVFAFFVAVVLIFILY